MVASSVASQKFKGNRRVGIPLPRGQTYALQMMRPMNTKHVHMQSLSPNLDQSHWSSSTHMGSTGMGSVNVRFVNVAWLASAAMSLCSRLTVVGAAGAGSMSMSSVGGVLVIAALGATSLVGVHT